MQEFIVVYDEKKVVGYDGIGELNEAKVSFNEKQRKLKADDLDEDIKDMDFSEAKKLDAIWGDEITVYETENVIWAVNKSDDIEEVDKEKLLKELKKDHIEFFIDDTVFNDIIDEVDPYHG